jgi:uncharacterized protein YbjT (DUF2867 family)
LSGVIVLLVGGTGMIGSRVASVLAKRGIAVRVLSRSAQKIAALDIPAVGILGDLNEPETLRAAFSDVDAVLIVTAHAITETGQGLGAVHAAIAAKVQRIVFISAAMPAGATRVPHIASKLPIEHALITARIEATILRPTHFFQNDLACEEAIAIGGVYPLPLGAKGVQRIDVADVADAAANALTRSGHAGRIYTLGAPESLTGNSIASTYSDLLDREVCYGGDDPTLWENSVGSRMPRWQKYDHRILFRYLQEHGVQMSARELLDAERVIGHEPRAFDEFAEEASRKWQLPREAVCGW